MYDQWLFLMACMLDGCILAAELLALAAVLVAMVAGWASVSPRRL